MVVYTQDLDNRQSLDEVTISVQINRLSALENKTRLNGQLLHNHSIVLADITGELQMISHYENLPI